jgi:hypothetical protein
MTSAVIGHMAQIVAIEASHAAVRSWHFISHHPKEQAVRTLCHSWLDSSQPKRMECEHDLLTAVWHCFSMAPSIDASGAI